MIRLLFLFVVFTAASSIGTRDGNKAALDGHVTAIGGGGIEESIGLETAKQALKTSMQVIPSTTGKASNSPGNRKKRSSNFWSREGNWRPGVKWPPGWKPGVKRGSGGGPGMKWGSGGEPTQRPRAIPTQRPRGIPTQRPRGRPTQRPGQSQRQRQRGRTTEMPKMQPTPWPRGKPTEMPKMQPTQRPGAIPTQRPGRKPGRKPGPLLALEWKPGNPRTHPFLVRYNPKVRKEAIKSMRSVSKPQIYTDLYAILVNIFEPWTIPGYKA